MFDEINAVEYKNNNDMEHNLFPIRITLKNTQKNNLHGLLFISQNSGKNSETSQLN